MALSTQEVVSDGTLTQLSLSIDFVTRSSIHVYFDNSEQTLGTTWSWVGTTGNTIEFAPAVTSSAVVLVRRGTDLTAATHVFNAGAQFNEASLDENFTQVLHASQEASEGSNVKDSFVNFDLHNHRIINVGAGTSDGDAVNKAQLDALTAGTVAIASAAAVYASDAAISASAAAISASAAATSETNAAASAVTAAAAAFANTAPTNITSINGGAIGGLRNRIINGNFAINQRAVSGTVTLAAGAYGHDRFKAGASGCTYTFATALNVTTLTISAGSLQQVVEGSNLQSGAVALSWQGTAQGKIGAGSYAASGVTGTAVGGSNLTVEFGAGTLRKVQLEAGTINSAFEQRTYSVELAMCQRYYLRYVRPNWIQVIATGATGPYTISTTFPVEMRAAPAIVLSNIVSNEGVIYGANSTNNGLDVAWNCLTVGQANILFTISASAEL